MPSFWKSLIGVVKSNLFKDATEALANITSEVNEQLFGVDFTDMAAQNVPGQTGAQFADLAAAAGIPDIPDSTSTDASVLATLNEMANQAIQSGDSRISSTPRGIRQLSGIVVNRVGKAMTGPAMHKLLKKAPGNVGLAFRALEGGQAAIKEIGEAIKGGLSLKQYRLRIKVDANGVARVVGQPNAYRSLMSYLSEFTDPRRTKIDISAYFRNPMDAQGNIDRQIAGLPIKLLDSALTKTLPALARLSAQKQRFLKLASSAPDRLKKADRAKFLAAINEYDRNARARMLQLGEDLAAQRITYKQFRRGMEGEIRRTVIAETILSIGGIGNITDKVLANVRQRIQTDMKSLDDFIGELKDRGSKIDDLFGTDSARGGNKSPNVPDVDAVPGQSLENAIVNLNVPRFSDTNITDDSYADVGSITGDDLQTISKSSQAFETAQINFSELVQENQNEYNLMEVRRLEEGVHNCDFCISWADKPMPAGQLPPIGDAGCDGVRYDTGGCHCVMDVPSDEEIEAMGGDE